MSSSYPPSFLGRFGSIEVDKSSPNSFRCSAVVGGPPSSNGRFGSMISCTLYIVFSVVALSGAIFTFTMMVPLGITMSSVERRCMKA